MITMPAMDSIDMRIGCTDEDLVCKGVYESVRIIEVSDC